MRYEYRCDKCGKEIEVLQKVDDPAPKCCKGSMRRLISLSTFILKGTGWYKTGYGSQTKGKQNGKKKK